MSLGFVTKPCQEGLEGSDQWDLTPSPTHTRNAHSMGCKGLFSSPLTQQPGKSGSTAPLTQKQPPRASAGILPGCKQKLLLPPCTSLPWCLFIHPRTLKQAALLSCMHMSLQFHRNYAEQVHGLIGICNPPAQQK